MSDVSMDAMLQGLVRNAVRALLDKELPGLLVEHRRQYHLDMIAAHQLVLDEPAASPNKEPDAAVPSNKARESKTGIKRSASLLPNSHYDEQVRETLALAILREAGPAGLHRDAWLSSFLTAYPPAARAYGEDYRGSSKSGHAAARGFFFRLIARVKARNLVTGGDGHLYRAASRTRT